MSERANRMTVRDLIAALQAFPPDAEVMVDGYEGGYDYPYPPVLASVYLDHDETSRLFGRFQEASGGGPAVIIGRSEFSVVGE